MDDIEIKLRTTWAKIVGSDLPVLVHAVAQHLYDEDPNYQEGVIMEEKASWGDEIEAWGTINLSIPDEAFQISLMAADFSGGPESEND